MFSLYISLARTASHAQSLPGINGIAITMIDLNQSRFMPWGLREEPIFSKHLPPQPELNWSLSVQLRGNRCWVDAAGVGHSGLGELVKCLLIIKRFTWLLALNGTKQPKE